MHKHFPPHNCSQGVSFSAPTLLCHPANTEYVARVEQLWGEVEAELEEEVGALEGRQASAAEPAHMAAAAAAAVVGPG